MQQENKKRGRPKAFDKKLNQTFRINGSAIKFLKTLDNYNNFINNLILNSNEYKKFISTRTEIKN